MGEEDEAGDVPDAVERVPEVTSKPGGMFRDLLEGSFPELYEEPKPEPEGGEGEEGEDGGDGDGAPAEPPAGDPPAEGEEDAEPEVDEYQHEVLREPLGVLARSGDAAGGGHRQTHETERACGETSS